MPDTVTAPAGAQPSTLTLETASQAENLDQIGGLAGSLERGAAPGQPGAPGAAPGTAVAGMPDPLAIKNAHVVLGAVCAFRDAFSEFTGLKAPKAVATDRELATLADGWGKWAAKRGYDLDALTKGQGDTIGLIVSTGALAWAVYQATMAEVALRKPVEVKKETSTPAAPPPAADQVATGGNVSVFPGRGGPEQ